jgi:hypothetical protein
MLVVNFHVVFTCFPLRKRCVWLCAVMLAFVFMFVSVFVFMFVFGFNNTGGKCKGGVSRF